MENSLISWKLNVISNERLAKVRLRKHYNLLKYCLLLCFYRERERERERDSTKTLR